MEWPKVERYLKENFIYTKQTNPKEVSDPIVKAVEDGSKKTASAMKEAVESSKAMAEIELGQGVKISLPIQTKIKGDKGDSPTEEELLELIKPLIPKVQNGKDADEERIIREVVKKVPKNLTRDEEKKIVAQVLSKIKVKDGEDAVIDYDFILREASAMIAKEIEDVKPINDFQIREVVREMIRESRVFSQKEKEEIIKQVKKEVKVDPVSFSLFQRETTMGSIADVNLSNPTNGQSLTYQSSTGKWVNSTVSGGSGTPGGSDTQVQFNDGGSFGGDAGLTYNKTTDRLTAGNVAVTDDAYAAGWNGSTDVPTKNAVYDKIETLSAGSGHTIKEAGTPLTARSGLNFGTGFDVSDDAGNDETDVDLDLSEYTGADLPVAGGGTGAGTAADARTNLGLVIGTDVQAYDADLATLATAFTTASASGAASLKFHEDTDNGTNAVTLQGPASTTDVTITLPATAGTIALTSDVDDLSGVTDAATARTNLGLGTAATKATDLADLNEATIEAAIDTLANLTSVQGKTVTLADAGANAVFGWDDVAGAYENLTAAEVRGAIGLATSDSPQFTAIELGHASDTTISRSSAGNIAIEGNVVYRAGGTDVPLADGGTGASLADPNADRIMFWDDSAGAVTWLEATDGTSISGTELSSRATTKSIAQTTHGFSVGNLLYLNSTTYTLADKDTEAAAECVGIVSRVIDSNNFVLTTNGYVTGLSSLTAGTVYYVGDSGALTATEPTTAGQVSKPVLVADSTTSGFFSHAYRGILINANAVDTKVMQATVVDYTTNTSTGDGKAYFVVPQAMNGMVITRVHARVITAGTTNTTDIQIANVTDAVDILSTKLTIDSGETGSDTAATPAVINTSNDDLATNDLIRIDIDQVSTTPAKGLIVTIEAQLP